MTTVNVTTQTNTVEVTTAGVTTVVQVPKTSTVTATTAGPQGANGGTDIVLDTSPQLGGDLASNGNNILVADDDEIQLGNNGDLKFFHDSNSNNSVIQELGSGHLNINGDNVFIKNASGNEIKAKFTSDGAAELYYDGTKKFETTSTGIEVTGSVVADEVSLGDNDRLKFGDSDVLQIYHTGSDSVITETGAGNLLLGSDSSVFLYKPSTFESMLRAEANGPVELYYDNSKKIETTSTGIEVTGTCVATEFSGSGASLTSIGTTSLADDAVTAAKLADTAVTAGSYTSANITVDAQGRLTSAANGDVSIYAKFFGTGSVNFNASGGAVRSWLNTTPDFSSGTWSATSSAITVPATGLYMISINIFFVHDTSVNVNVRSNPRVSIAINGTEQTERTAHSYIRVASGHNESSANGTFYYQLSANDEVGVFSQRLAGTGTINVRNDSAITLVKIA